MVAKAIDQAEVILVAANEEECGMTVTMVECVSIWINFIIAQVQFDAVIVRTYIIRPFGQVFQLFTCTIK